MSSIAIRASKLEDMQILDNKQINQKIRRLAFEILEENSNVKNLILLGINSNGLSFANLLVKEYNAIAKHPASVGTIDLNPADPLSSEISLRIDGTKNLKGKNLIIVDDVANTGRTLFYAMKPLMVFLPKKVEVAVLVYRKHKSFPVKVDYVGLSLATTLKENIQVDIKKVRTKAAFLE